ncbi:MAG: hypothetical protein H6779_04205 [Candidatus Nomurabacteria bacterium]|nr:MAG: hypothetical protein H6779_04205 [Candidatus Nomurabacteria bacterium]
MLDEKRQQISVGDTITFTNADEKSDTVLVRVVDLVRFDTFKDLCEAHDPILYGSKNTEEYHLMYKYYSEAEEQKYGVLAIHLQII